MTANEYMTHEREQLERIRTRREKSRAALDIIERRHVPHMTPNDRVLLAQRLLVGVLDEGVSYADFQSAQAVERYVRKARNALRGLSLS